MFCVCKCDVRIEVVDDHIGEICYQTAGSWSGHLLAAQCGPWADGYKKSPDATAVLMMQALDVDAPRREQSQPVDVESWQYGRESMAHAWHTDGRPSGLVGWSSQSFLCGPCQSRVGICKPRSTNCSSSLTSSSPPHRMQLCRDQNGHCALHFLAFLHFSGQRRQPLQAARLLIQLATRDGRPPGPTLGDLRPVPRFTASPQESADGLLGACDPLCRFLPVSFRQADGADGADEADGAPRCYVVDLTRPARDKRRHVLMNGKGMLDRRSCIITSCLLSRPN